MKNLEQTVEVFKIIDGFTFRALELPYKIKLAGVEHLKITKLGKKQAHYLLKSLISRRRVKIVERTNVNKGQVEAEVDNGELSENDRMNNFLISNGYQ